MSIRFLPEARLPTSILHIKSKSPSSLSPLFVWIPGNPGIVQFYEEFLNSLHDKYDHLEILAISHGGMALEDPDLQKRKAKIYSLEDQILDKVEVINKFSGENRPLIVMGHSVGAYMAQHVIMNDRLVGKVVKLGLITPTVINIHLSQKGSQLTRAFYWIKYLPDLAALTSNILFNKLSSIMFTDEIISFFMGADKRSVPVATSKSFVQHSEIVRQALGLAALEMQQIRSSWPFQKKLIDHCNAEDIETKFLFATNDPWVSSPTREALIVFYRENLRDRNLEISVSNEIAHSFIIKHSERVTNEYF